MAVELWIGQEFDTSHEREALNRFLVQMNDKFGQSDKLYLILANYYVDGRQVDLTVLKQDAVIVIELKECSNPFRATENGDWQTIPDGVVIGTGKQNPFEQAKDYRFRWVNLVESNQAEFLPSGKAQSMDFYHVSAFVAISPSLHPDHENCLSYNPWFRLVGLDQLSDAVYQQTSRKLNFSEQELRTLVTDVLHLSRGDATPDVVTQDDGVLNQIGRYKILEQLGQGGMGTVYRAYDPDLDREVVVKLIISPTLTINDKWRERFRQEVQAASQLNDPHIVTIHDVGLDHEPPYVVMELLDGGTLEERLKQKSLTWQEGLTMSRLLAQALAYAHNAGVIHRDVKPANVMFTGDDLSTLKLVDFGLARRQGGEALTQAGDILGTPIYMSPEQALGEAVDQRTDIFALGIILFEALAGYNPLDKGSTILTLNEASSDSQIDTSSLVGKVPPAVIELIQRATAKDRDLRYQTGEELLADLDRCVDNLTADSTPVPSSDDKSRLTLATQKAASIQVPFETEIEPPYGTMPLDSKFYIERAADNDCWTYLSKTRATTVFIQALRQMGKSSLMRRMLHRAKKARHQPFAFIDFQRFPEQYFDNEESLLIDLCLMIGDALDIPEAIDRYWQGRRTNIRKCTLYLSEYIIPKVNKPFILAMDEVERMLDSPFQANFFGMLRTWHNDRAYDENFARMTLFLSSSTEPYLFIDNPNRSPFNVAEVISLQDFSPAEVEELNRRHRSPLSSSQISDLMDLVGGHPFLIRVALYQLATGKFDLSTLLAQATEDSGPFKEHLQYYHQHILEKPALKEALAYICRHHTYEENKIFHRLKGAGLIKKVGSHVILRNNLYTRYFEERLND